jgi:acetyl-CoA carboxylase biotin carboxyl carrier protein
MIDLSHEDVAEILSAFDASGYAELRLELGDLKLHVRKDDGRPAGDAIGAGAAPPQQLPAAAAPGTTDLSATTVPVDGGPAPAGGDVPEGCVAVRAPMLGAFYSAPSPDQPPFVEVGDMVEATQDVCLIEVMKLFSSVAAGAAGRIVDIRPENGAMVEYDEVLMVIEPKGRDA